MNRQELQKLNRMLSNKELSVQEKEIMLQNLLGDADRYETHRHLVFRPVWVGAAAAAMAAILLLVFGLYRDERSPNGAFTVRGATETGSFRFTCVDNTGQTSVCRQGNTIAFGVLPPEKAAFFSAAALNQKGTLIRYFPSTTEKSVVFRTTAFKKEVWKSVKSIRSEHTGYLECSAHHR